MLVHIYPAEEPGLRMQGIQRGMTRVQLPFDNRAKPEI